MRLQRIKIVSNDRLTERRKKKKKDNSGGVRLFAFPYSALNLRWVTTRSWFQWFVFDSTAATPMVAAPCGTCGVWNESVSLHARLQENTNFPSRLSPPPPPPHPAFDRLRPTLCYSIWTDEISHRRPICCVYDSFVYSLVHIRARRGQGDSFSAGLGPNSEVNLAQWFITLLTK